MEITGKRQSGLRLVNRSRGSVIADRVELATSFWARTRGLMGRRRLPPDFALVIHPCRGVHSLGMSLAVDVVHVDGRGRVVRILHDLRPWRVGPLVWRSRWVIELPAGTARATGTEVGDRVEVIGVEHEGPDT